MSGPLRIAPLPIAVAVSALLHILLLAGMLLLPRQPPAQMAAQVAAQMAAESPDTQAQVELLMVEQIGAGETAVAASEHASVEKPAPVGDQSLEERSSEEKSPEEPSPEEIPRPWQVEAAPTPQPAQSPAPAAAPAAALQMNLGGTDSPSNAIALGDSFIPASPDNRARNRPPIYPAEAVRRRQQGSVLVMIHVSAEGLAVGVDVVQSSGYPALDRAARLAVLDWRFVPAMKDGAPIPFDMPFSVVFQAD